MDISPESELGKILNKLENKKRSRADVASAFPASSEAYRQLPLEERLEMAAQIMKSYTSVRGNLVPSESSVAKTSLQSGQQGVTIEALVGHDQGSWRSAINDTMVTEQPSIKVWVRAVDQGNEVSTCFEQLGKIELGSGATAEGEWLRGIHCVPAGLRAYAIPLSEDLSVQLVEIVDAAACGVIEDTIAKHQRLGTAAIASLVD